MSEGEKVSQKGDTEERRFGVGRREVVWADGHRVGKTLTRRGAVSKWFISWKRGLKSANDRIRDYVSGHVMHIYYTPRHRHTDTQTTHVDALTHTHVCVYAHIIQL
jgi:hypothetical protein